MKFSELQLNSYMLRAVSDCGYEDLTYIQEKGIPEILKGNDVIGQSQTGTGKTAAFGIPLVQMLEPQSGKKLPQLLILLPTRELALQVTEEIRKFAKYKEGIRTVSIYGGEPINNQISELRKGADIVVGTPGRVLDHINRSTLKFENCYKLVLDEADEMLNMGFIDDIEAILAELPANRQTLLFSATMPKAILELANRYLVDPVHIKTESKKLTAENIEQYYYECNQSDKKNVLIQLIELKRPQYAMVFCNTKKMVDDLTSELVAKGYPAAAIHGDMPQEARIRVMERFKKHMINILICTDVAARGIDINNLDMVFNYDFPQEYEYYVHRIGRTGRAGKKGEAITFLTPRENKLVKEVKKLSNAEIVKQQLPNAADISKIRLEQLGEDLKHMLELPISEEIKDIINKYEANGFSLTDIACALLQKDYNSSLMQQIENPIESNTLEVVSDEKLWIEINIGKSNKVTTAHIVSAIAEATGMDGKYVGKIIVQEERSYVAVPKEHASLIVDALYNTTIRNLPVEAHITDDPVKKAKEKKAKRNETLFEKEKVAERKNQEAKKKASVIKTGKKETKPRSKKSEKVSSRTKKATREVKSARGRGRRR